MPHLQCNRTRERPDKSPGRAESLFGSQQFATSVYRTELAGRLHDLGYEIERGKHGQPEIKGYSQEYLEASSPRREQIKAHLEEIGREGAGAAQVAAHRNPRLQGDPVARRGAASAPRACRAVYGHQADWVVSKALRNGHRQEADSSKIAQQAVIDSGGLLPQSPCCYWAHLLERGLSPSTINVQLSAIRKLVAEARCHGILRFRDRGLDHRRTQRFVSRERAWENG
jgi:hypothetical protein